MITFCRKHWEFGICIGLHVCKCKYLSHVWEFGSLLDTVLTFGNLVIFQTLFSHLEIWQYFRHCSHIKEFGYLLDTVLTFGNLVIFKFQALFSHLGIWLSFRHCSHIWEFVAVFQALFSHLRIWQSQQKRTFGTQTKHVSMHELVQPQLSLLIVL